MVRRIAQNVINHMMTFDPETQEGFQGFSGKAIKMQVTDIDSISYLHITESGFEILRAYEGEVTATISGSMVALGQLGVQQFFNGVGKRQSVSIEGDLEFVQQLLQLSKKYRLDWEEILAKAFGDVIGHQVGNGVRGLVNWIRGSAQKTKGDLAEYLQEEVRLLPSREEVNIFYDNVDALRSDFDRVEIKVRRLLGE